jgi:hypothetical protein
MCLEGGKKRRKKRREKKKKKKILAERGFDPRTSGLWAQHASTAPLCSHSGPGAKAVIASREIGEREREREE